MKTTTLALCIAFESGEPLCVDALTQESEIQLLERLILQNAPDPLAQLNQFRSEQAQREEEFGDSAEQQLCNPFVREPLRSQAIQWFRAQIQVEQFQKREKEAVEVLSRFAFDFWRAHPAQTQFLIQNDRAQVKVRVFIVHSLGSGRVRA
ncbi:MAG: hypothetical protein ACO3A2_05985 [Bdellovibrionia bacterium]